MDTESIKLSLETRKGRIALINKFHNEEEENWQSVPTPLDICNEMIDLVEERDCNYAVLFSAEFLEILIYDKKIDRSRIVFFADNGSELIAKKVYKVKTILLDKKEILDRGFNKNIFLSNIGSSLEFPKEHDMKFNKLVVVGNPPYQMMNQIQNTIERDGGGDSAKPIYHLFIETILDNLNPDYLTLIVPSRWMAGGQGLDKFRNRMMNDRHLKVIRDFKGTFDVFPSVQIAGGVNYFLWDKSHNDSCDFNGVERNLNDYDIIVRDNESIGILEKVRSMSSSYVSSMVSTQKPYGITGNSKPSDNGVPCYFKQSIGKRFTTDSISDNRNDIDTWRVLIPYILHPPHDNKPFMAFNSGRLNIAEPGSVCSESFLVVGRFKTENEAKNFITYFGTKFFRFLMRIRICSLHASRSVYGFVPDMIDYSNPFCDDYLYKRFNLTEAETEYIESKIREFK